MPPTVRWIRSRSRERPIRAPPPPTGDAELAEEYRRTLDPFVALGAAAAVTSKLRLGTGICLVAQRDPIVLAKEVATLDWLSKVAHPPPVLLGGAPGPKLFAHIAEYCDGWLPIGGGGIAGALPALRGAFAALGAQSCEFAGRSLRYGAE